MNPRGHKCLLYIAATLAVLGVATSIRIEINPSRHRGIDHNPVNVTCIPEVTDNGVIQEVVLLEVSKDDGKPLALIRQNSQVSYGIDSLKNFQVEGVIGADAAHSYLRLSFPHPAPNDTGIYTCVLYYLDRNGLLKEARASGNLTVEDFNDILDDLMAKVSQIDDVVSLVERVKKLETASLSTTKQIRTLDSSVTSLADRMTRLEKDCPNNCQTTSNTLFAGLNSKVTQCLNEVSVVEEEVKNVSKSVESNKKVEQQHDSVIMDKLHVLEEANRDHSSTITSLSYQNNQTSKAMAAMEDYQYQLSQDLTDLKNHVRDTASATTTTGFSSAINQRTSFIVGNVISFPDVIMNQGQGFDATSGVYTAPRDGLYSFHLVMAIDRHCQNCDVQIEMKKNSNQVLTTLNLIGSGTYTDRVHSVSPQSSVSVLVNLNVGDTVSNVLSTKLRQATFDTHSLRSSVFTGYLVV